LRMPRKKKKKFKKSALMLYSVACWAENIWYEDIVNHEEVLYALCERKKVTI
jgi:hypothetical protein